MGFFDDVYRSPRYSQAAGDVPAASFAPRSARLPGRLPWERVLARTGTVCIAWDSVACWPEHFTAEIVVFSTRPPVDGDEFLPFPGGLSDSGLRLDVTGIRFAIQFSDGRYATNLMVPRMASPHSGTRSSEFPIFTPWGGTGGGGGERWRYVQRLDLWPLPPPGKTTVILDWIDEGIAETRHELRGDEFKATGKRS